jgi:hypothetical protein
MEKQVILEFAVSTLLVLACVIIHGVGLFSLNKALRSEASIERMRRLDPLSLRGVLFTFAIVLLLIALHSIEIWLFAGTYILLGAHDTLEEALYVSTIAYSTVGFNDALIDQSWRLIAAFEAILGVIMLGWSTAFFFRMLGRIDDR